MKNQFVGDVDDYGKLGLLRFLAARGITVGVNWYLTPEERDADESGNGFLAIMRMRETEPELYDHLYYIVETDTRRVESIEEHGLVPHATYYAKMMPVCDTARERDRLRTEWFEGSLEKLSAANLVFCDPDVGMLPENKSVRQKGSEAYVLPEEVVAYYEQGHDVVYSCQKGRRKWTVWEEMKTQMQRHLPDAKIVCLTYEQGRERTYVFVLHPESYGNYIKMITAFERTSWRNQFTRGVVGGRTPGSELTGEEFSFETSNGEVITIAKNANGDICIRSSWNRNMSHIYTPDGLAKLIFMRW